MMLKHLICLSIVALVLLSIQAECKAIANEFSSDQVEYDDPVPPLPPRRGGSLSRKVTAWMNFITGFFKDGNWTNGGPDDFARFVADKVHNLIKMLDED